MPTIQIYVDDYFNAMRLTNTLYRPAIDGCNSVITTKELWERGKPLIVSQNDTVWEIYKR